MDTLFSITAGPSKFDLMLSLFERKRVEFTIDEFGKQGAIVRTISADVESGESWSIEGHLTQLTIDRLRPHFRGHFDTGRRQGAIYIEGVSRCCTECGTELEIFGQCKHCQSKRHCTDCGEEVVNNDGTHCTHCGAQLT